MQEAVSHAASLLVLRLKYRWHYGVLQQQRGQTMTLVCQLVRTKNFLIMSTSLMFLVCTVYLASHPGWVGDYGTLDGGGGANLRVQANPAAVKYFEVPATYLQLLGLNVNTSVAPAAGSASAIEAVANDDSIGQTSAPPLPVRRWSVLLDVEQRRANSSLLGSLDMLLVSAASTSGVDKTLRLVASIKQHVPHLYLLLFDLGLDKEAKEKLVIYCNLTSVCELLPFQSDPFPAYVREPEVGAYKALIIQACLVHFPTVWWVDAEEYFVSNATEPVLRVVGRLGVAAWQAPSLDSTSALSHPNMFAYFGRTADDFYFHRMLQPSHYVFSSPRFRSSGGEAARRVPLAAPPADATAAAATSEATMLLWLQCALTQGCVSPPGAMSSGCKEKRPKFKYSGCHEFEASALSAALGRAFGFAQDYLLSNSSFVVVGSMQQGGGGLASEAAFVPLFGSDDGSRFNMSAVYLAIERERARAEAAATHLSAAAAEGSTGQPSPEYVAPLLLPATADSWRGRQTPQAAYGHAGAPAVQRLLNVAELPVEDGASDGKP